MDDDNDDQGLRLDTGSYVEDARDYNPEDPDPDQEDDSLIEKVQNALSGDDGANGIDGDEEDELEPVDDNEEM